MKRWLITVSVIYFFLWAGWAQQSDTIVTKSEVIKKGWSFGVLPSVSYDSDLGLTYGVFFNLYNFGNGLQYPDYRHSYFVDANKTTKGATNFVFQYDSKYLIEGLRFSGEFNLSDEQALNFYGFNGNEVNYRVDYEEDGNPLYISRMFYAMNRRQIKVRADVYGNSLGHHLKWLAGVECSDFKLGTVDIDRLNEGKNSDDVLPDTALLYDKYVAWGVIKSEEQRGGFIPLLKVGLVYDTRDEEPNPMHGVWSDVQLLTAQSFWGSSSSFSRLALTHRQYVTLVDKILSFAFRVSYQTKIGGSMPFYALPFVYNTAPNFTRDGLGGKKTLRGVLRNRVVGEGFVYGNNELRYKVLRTVLFNQNFYISLNGFFDWGMVTQRYNIDLSGVPEEERTLFFTDKREKMHFTYGGGVRFVLNSNFIVAVDYGRAMAKSDGDSGLYINLNFLY